MSPERNLDSGPPTADQPFLDVASSSVIGRKWLFRALFAVMATAILYASITAWLGRAGWELAVKTISGADILVILGLVTLGVMIRALRWHYFISVLKWDVPAVPSVAAFIASFALTTTPGKAGEVVKVMLLHHRPKVSLPQGAGILLIERFGDLAAVLILAAGGLAIFPDENLYAVTGVILVAIAALVGLSSLLPRPMILRVFPSPKLRQFVLRVFKMLDAVRQLLRVVPMIVGTGLAVLAWGCEALAFYLLVAKLGIQATPMLSASIYGLSTIAGALSMLPGGIGGFEVVMAFLLTRVGASTSLAAVAIVIFRLCTIWFVSFVGIVFMVGWMMLLSRRPNGMTFETRPD